MDCWANDSCQREWASWWPSMHHAQSPQYSLSGSTPQCGPWRNMHTRPHTNCSSVLVSGQQGTGWAQGHEKEGLTLLRELLCKDCHPSVHLPCEWQGLSLGHFLLLQPPVWPDHTLQLWPCHSSAQKCSVAGPCPPNALVWHYEPPTT